MKFICLALWFCFFAIPAKADFVNFVKTSGVAPANTVAPVISGTATIGSTLSTTDGTWTGTPTPTYTYQWKRAGSNISSATNSSYVLVAADAGSAITCTVTATNTSGNANATSNSITPNFSDLSSAISSTVFQLDATISASTDGSSQTWANIIASPADGSAQTAYDFWRGGTNSVTTDDPTFNGSAGTNNAYWSFDGGDKFQLKTANTTFLNNLPKTTGGSAYWFVVTGNFSDTTGIDGLMGTGSATQTGVRVQTTVLNGINVGQREPSTNVTVSTAANTFTDSVDFIFVVSVPAGGGTIRVWVNSRTGEDLTLTYTTGTNNSGNTFQLGCSGNITNPLPSGSKIYGMAMGNGTLVDADVVNIANYYNTLYSKNIM